MKPSFPAGLEYILWKSYKIYVKNILFMHCFFQTSLPINITDVLGRGKVRVVCLESLARKCIPLLEAFYGKNFSKPNFNT